MQRQDHLLINCMKYRAHNYRITKQEGPNKSLNNSPAQK